MNIGIGLPNGVPGTSGDQLVEWAIRAEKRGFSSLGALDRLVYENYEPLVALSAAAAVTERIGLCSSVILAPLRLNAAILMKQALSIQALSGGRLTLGLGVGGRPDDHALAGAELSQRGAMFDAILEQIKELEKSGEIGPTAKPPEILVGGFIDAAFERVARFGDGWFGGGGTADRFRGGAERARSAWDQAGREGSPRLACVVNFALGGDPSTVARAWVEDYYRFLGPDWVDTFMRDAVLDSDKAQAYVADFADAGCDELLFLPCGNDPDEVDRLADAVGLN